MGVVVRNYEGEFMVGLSNLCVSMGDALWRTALALSRALVFFVEIRFYVT